jgi:hypothetical protein
MASVLVELGIETARISRRIAHQAFPVTHMEAAGNHGAADEPAVGFASRV